MKLKALTDKDLIVYLTAIGLEIKEIKKDNGKNRSLVYFEDNEELEKQILNYVNKSNSNVNITDFLAAERRIKTLLCMQKN